MTTTTATTRATLEELLGRMGRFEPDSVAALFAENVDWDVPGDGRVPWVGARSRRDEVAAYFRTLWSVCDTAQSDTAVSQVLVDGPDAVVLGVLSQTIRATHRRFSTHVAVHICVEDGLITRLRIYEDSYAVSDAFAGHP